jgi:predicted amidophosphoribosyltransferase
METANVQLTVRLQTTGMTEALFRKFAGLCTACGEARSEPDREYCEQCQKQRDTPAMERAWAKWGIAA